MIHSQLYTFAWNVFNVSNDTMSNYSKIRVSCVKLDLMNKHLRDVFIQCVPFVRERFLKERSLAGARYRFGDRTTHKL